jgi:hypothetical protein
VSGDLSSTTLITNDRCTKFTFQFDASELLIVATLFEVKLHCVALEMEETRTRQS